MTTNGERHTGCLRSSSTPGLSTTHDGAARAAAVMPALAKLLIDTRAERKVSRIRAAEKIGVSPVTLWSIEKQLRLSCQAGVMLAITQWAGTTVDAMLDRYQGID